jgi:hypothetical protein
MNLRVLVFPLLLAAAGEALLAQSPGTFIATGNLSTPRFGHTATLLRNGKVLITGGGGSVGGGSAELYDTAIGTFVATGNMITVRFGHSATLLPDGKVLIAGGTIANSAAGNTNTAGAELYDPATGTFTPTGDMLAAKGCPAATLLGNGKVLIAGGASWNEPSGAATAELYDPETGTFAATEKYANANALRNADLNFCPRANLLADGRVSIVWDDMASSAEIYDPGAGTFSFAGNIIRPAGTISPATLLTNGKVLFAGGEDGETAFGFAEAQLYDSSTGTSSATGNMTTRRFDHTAVLLPDGTVLIAGSQRSGFYDGTGPHALGSAEIYDPLTSTFAATGDMITPRFAHTATLLTDGKVLIAGGIANGAADPGARAELYYPAVLTPAPVLFALSQAGGGQGAIWHAVTGQVASSSNPAVAGETLAMYTTSLADGGVVPPQVVIGGRLAEVVYFGDAPGYTGVNQVNFRVPGGVARGPAVAVYLTYLGRPSNEVTIGVQ